MSKSEEGNIFDDLTLGITQTLGKRKGVVDVKLQKKNGADRSQVLSWEQKYSCIMPEDMKSFLLTSNGLLLTWSVKVTEGKIPVGKMEINPVEKLGRLGGTTTTDRSMPSLFDITESDDEADPDDCRPKFDHRSRIFEVDACDGYGKVCVVYKNTKPGDIADPGIPAQKAEMWFLDRSLQWHFLADSFLNYFRLMLTHLGLPHWQYAFTDIGLPPQSQQWFNLYCPVRLQKEDLFKDASSESSSFLLNCDRVFRGKPDKKKQQTAPLTQNMNKKKVPVSSARQIPGGSNKTFPQSQGNKINR